MAVSRAEQLIAYAAVSSDTFVHAEQLHPLLEKVMGEAGIVWSELSAVAISKGPGSYTGLRIGTSAAKGICYALSIPLIAIDTLFLLALEASASNPHRAEILPMIDARRMEVYTSRFDESGRRISADEAVIIDEKFFSNLTSQRYILVGDGAPKCAPLAGENIEIRNVLPEARMMVIPALEAFHCGSFEDVAYFEPFYLKAYQPGISKRSVL